LKSAEETSMTDAGLTPKTKYCYKVSAYDAGGNESAQSTDVCAIL
jgi:chitodextrinase